METIHNSLNNLCNNVIERIPKGESGTYNNADPTYYEKGSTYVQWNNKWWKLKYWDCVWGVEITIYRVKPRFTDIDYKGKPDGSYLWQEIELGSFYITTDTYPKEGGGWKHVTKVIPRQKPKGLIKLMYSLSKLLPEPKEEIYFEDAMPIRLYVK